MSIEKIEKLLGSSNLEDIKLGVLYYCESHTPEEIVEYFMRDVNHKCRNVPDYLPEHPIENDTHSVVIYYTYTGLSGKSQFTDRNPEKDELF